MDWDEKQDGLLCGIRWDRREVEEGRTNEGLL